MLLLLFEVFYYLYLQSCQADLVKDNGHKYFLSVLADSYMPVSTHNPLQSPALASPPSPHLLLLCSRPSIEPWLCSSWL